MKEKNLRIIWGVVAVGIYLFVVSLLLLYFNYHDSETKKHYVKKDEHRIQVGLSAPRKKALPKKHKKKESRKKQVSKPKKVHMKPAKKVQSHKKVIKERLVKKRIKRKDINATKLKRRKTKDLFASIKTPKKRPVIKVTDKPIKRKPKKQLFEMKDVPMSASERIKHSLKKQKSYDSGVEDSYLAKVQEMLEAWPAQSDFAGEKVKVHLKIDPTGHFEFEIKRRSQNPVFNQALTEFLEQLQEFGFGPHRGSRTYLFEAEFIAKD